MERISGLLKEAEGHLASGMCLGGVEVSERPVPETHQALGSLLNNRRMDAPSVLFQAEFARTRRPSYVFQQAANHLPSKARGTSNAKANDSTNSCVKGD